MHQDERTFLSSFFCALERVVQLPLWLLNANLSNNMNQLHNSRRDFLKNAGLLGAAAAFPNILSNFGGEKVNLACIGIGNQGGLDVMSLYNTGLANIVALCDVDMGAPQTLKVLENSQMCLASKISVKCLTKWDRKSRPFQLVFQITLTSLSR